MTVHTTVTDSHETQMPEPGRQTGIALLAFGFLVLLATAAGLSSNPLWMFVVSFGGIGIGSVLVIHTGQMKTPPGIRNNFIVTASATSRGAAGVVLFGVITLFYVLLYWFPGYLSNLIRIFDPLCQFLRNRPADQWFLYSTCYTFAILIMGYRMILKYRHSRYQVVRTISVMFFQLVFAYLIPSLMMTLNQPEFYFSYFWPLTYNGLFPSTLEGLKSHPGGIGFYLFLWGGMMTFIATPILTWFFGKRWYCTWVCGCGGLANTAGDPFRQLSDKSLCAWKIERYSIHSVLILISVTTGLLWINSLSGGTVLGSLSAKFAKAYGFFIGAAFAGVIGVGFYPILGSRVWCRFGCPMAAILGILQKKCSRYRITTNGAQCISCGNCSKYCEMGIDVRWYAQRGQDIVRASCVGCGICAAVCPRGVLSLENGPMKLRRYENLTMLKTIKSVNGDAQSSF